MNPQSNDIPSDTGDARSLATLIIELNIARRNCRAYPAGHPVVAASLAKVLSVYEELLNKHDELILGVATDTLMVDGVALEKTNLVYRDFSRALFERGIGAILFHRGITIEELTAFTIILGHKREQINLLGGIEQVWAEARITSMSIRPIRYDLFKSTDEDTISPGSDLPTGEQLWERFARELTRGDLDGPGNEETRLDPEILAEVLNLQHTRGAIDSADLNRIISAFLTPGGDGTHPESLAGQPVQKLAAFISNLTPELRRQFIASSFGGGNRNMQNVAEPVLAGLSDSAIIETLEDINQSRITVSPVVLALLERLGQNAGGSRSAIEELSAEDDLSAKMKTIFREHASEEFVPDDYQKKLNLIIASDKMSRLNMEEVDELLTTVENRSIESSIGQILINLIREGAESPEERELLTQNLTDMLVYFLQTGDYAQLCKMIDQLNDSTFPDEIHQRLRDEYGRRDFLDEILDGLVIWGKPCYSDIRSLIHKIGGGFVEAILDRLSEESNMSLRRFYMDCLTEMGPLSREAIAGRLFDPRWYFLRNLLIILTAQNDPSVVSMIRPLLRSEDPRLRQEVLKALVHFRDPHVEKQILEDLDSQNAELQTAAILLAERCTAPAVASRLTGILTQGGFSQAECERKSAIVHALGEIGRAEVLPELAKILGSRSMLHSRQLSNLKTEIIHSLPKYPPGISRPVLEHIANGSGEIARLAAETLRIISGNNA